MNRVLRAAITWLLLIAVPLQGYAAGSMLFCGDASAGAAASVEHPHHHAGSHADSHHHLDGAAAPSDDAGDRSPHDAVHGKCSVCASCCSAAALPTTGIAALLPAPEAAPAIQQAQADAIHEPARLERPPRLIVA